MQHRPGGLLGAGPARAAARGDRDAEQREIHRRRDGRRRPSRGRGRRRPRGGLGR
jgi:hypothetical protein